MPSNDIISTVHYLKQALEHMRSFIRDRPGSALARPFKTYRDRVEWIFRDIASNPAMTQEVRGGLRSELNSDLFLIPDLVGKIRLLSPAKRDMAERLIDALLSGEEIQVELNKKEEVC